MYSNLDLKAAIKSGDLVIDPLNPDLIKSAAISMLLGKIILVPRTGKTVDVKNKIIPDYDEYDLETAGSYTINPGDFLLAHTNEKVSVSEKLGFMLEGRSTLARVGLTVVQTAMLIYPGHKDRCITLELANHGPNPIILYYHMKIARGVVFELKTPTDAPYDANSGKYRNQQIVGKPVFAEEIV